MSQKSPINLYIHTVVTYNYRTNECPTMLLFPIVFHCEQQQYIV